MSDAGRCPRRTNTRKEILSLAVPNPIGPDNPKPSDKLKPQSRYDSRESLWELAFLEASWALPHASGALHMAVGEAFFVTAFPVASGSGNCT